MRTTLTIDDDLMAVVKSIAQAKGKTVGAALSELAWRGLNSAPRVEKDPDDGGFPVFKVSPGSRPITMEDVKRLEDEY